MSSCFRFFQKAETPSITDLADSAGTTLNDFANEQIEEVPSLIVKEILHGQGGGFANKFLTKLLDGQLANAINSYIDLTLPKAAAYIKKNGHDPLEYETKHGNVHKLNLEGLSSIKRTGEAVVTENKKVVGERHVDLQLYLGFQQLAAVANIVLWLLAVFPVRGIATASSTDSNIFLHVRFYREPNRSPELRRFELVNLGEVKNAEFQGTNYIGRFISRFFSGSFLSYLKLKLQVRLPHVLREKIQEGLNHLVGIVTNSGTLLMQLDDTQPNLHEVCPSKTHLSEKFKSRACRRRYFW